MTLRLLDLFSGIGGFSYAAERLVGGFSTTAFVEREPFCQSILRKHWPDVPIHDDITTFAPAFASADVICGGFPCQDISQAGKGAGIKEGTRSGLFFEMVRVIRLVRPRFVVMENVQRSLLTDWALFSGKWPRSGMTVNGVAYALQMWAPATCVTDGGVLQRLLPTPTTRDHKDGSQHSCANTPVNGLLGRRIHQVACSPPTGEAMYLNPALSRR